MPDHHHLHGLRADLPQLVALARRRQALRLFGGLGLAGGLPLLAACGGGGSDTGTASSGTGTTTTTTTTTTGSSCSTIPAETAGPYPGDGTNSSSNGVANALLLSGIVRSDIRSSVAGASGTAAGVPMTVTLQLVDTGSSCSVLAGFAVSRVRHQTAVSGVFRPPTLLESTT